ncbi:MULTISPECIES: phosphotransferase family protein [unclassified Paenibacillus]|uniref:phosphotransferase family protein n=1 Tax=unclassified Paenibacillus TaxID=185978 RepID=UPI0030F9A352
MRFELGGGKDFIEETVRQFLSDKARVLDIESTRLHSGYQAVDLFRHRILVESEGRQEYSSVITKMASGNERRVMNRLFDQGANVPFNKAGDLNSDHRALLCIQDVDYKTNYQNLDIGMLQHKEMQALAYIHNRNRGLQEELSWLPRINRAYIETIIDGVWRPAWEETQHNERFVETFGTYISEVNAISEKIVDELEALWKDEATHTLIHNDLNPGNVLVHNNDDVMFIDWEEARYGSLFLDIPMRVDRSQAGEYREVLASLGWVLPANTFEQRYRAASRYLGLRYMTWSLGAWLQDSGTEGGLRRYLDMVIV